MVVMEFSWPDTVNTPEPLMAHALETPLITLHEKQSSIKEESLSK